MMARDERDVTKIVEYVASSQNPFDLDTVPGELINITIGQVASPKVSKWTGQFSGSYAETEHHFRREAASG
jgi:hypothetical protein